MISNMQQNFDKDIIESFLNSGSSGIIITSNNDTSKSQNNNSGNMNNINNNNILTSHIVKTAAQTLNEKAINPGIVYLINQSSENAKENENNTSSQTINNYGYNRNDGQKIVIVNDDSMELKRNININNNNNNNKSNVINNINDSAITMNSRMHEITSAFYQTNDNSHRKPIFDANKHNQMKISNSKSTMMIMDVPTVLPLRNESQENAFLQIERVHNYSKASRIGHDKNTTSSSQDDEDDNNNEEKNNFIDVAIKGVHSKKKKKSIDRKGFKIPVADINYDHINNDYENGYDEDDDDNDDDDDDGVDDNDHRKQARKTDSNVPENDEDKIAPDHHARRPMNAFLIFCKRHRTIVREKYKTLENRSITKILGDWWATLSMEEKACYTDLAKQYKDAFFSANPNFKWYKLPAPPLRTLNTRPSNAERPLTVTNMNYSHTNDYETITSNKEFLNRGGNNNNNNNNSNNNYNKSSTATNYQHEKNDNNDIYERHSYYNHKKYSSDVGVFKLADEAQMGGLNNLITNNRQQNTIGQNPTKEIAIISDTEAKTEQIDDNTRSVSMSTLSSIQNPLLHMKNQAEKRKASGDRNLNECKKMMFEYDNTSNFTMDNNKKKSVRSCKGKKYQEFISSGQITSFIKKSKSKTFSTNSSFRYNSDYYRSYDNGRNQNIIKMVASPEHFENLQIKIEDGTPGKMYMSPLSNAAELSPTKQFDASDFDLEKKIKDLPAQNLDNYLQRKRDTKKKKKINSKRRNSANGAKNKNQSTSPKTIEEVRNRLQRTIVGSQKRKARKESITRRDVSAIYSSDIQSNIYETVESLVQLGASGDRGCNGGNMTAAGGAAIAATAIKEDTEIQGKNNSNIESHTNLHLLNILAEVATNHIKVENT